MTAKLLDVVADTPHAELAEIREVFPNLRGVEVELLGKSLRRDGSHARGIERVQAAQIHRQPVGRELRDSLRRLRPAEVVQRSACERPGVLPCLTSLDCTWTRGAPRVPAGARSPCYAPADVACRQVPDSALTALPSVAELPFHIMGRLPETARDRTVPGTRSSRVSRARRYSSASATCHSASARWAWLAGRSRRHSRREPARMAPVRPGDPRRRRRHRADLSRRFRRRRCATSSRTPARGSPSCRPASSSTSCRRFGICCRRSKRWS